MRLYTRWRTGLAIGAFAALLAGCASAGGEAVNSGRAGEEIQGQQLGSSDVAPVAHSSISMGRAVNRDGMPVVQEAEMPPPPPRHEFAMSSGKWFEGRGLELSYSAGVQKPGSEVSILLRPSSAGGKTELAARTIRYQLTEREKDGQLIAVVDTKLHRMDAELGYSFYAPKLPEKEGVYYYLTAEIMDGDTVEDTLLASVEVPPQRVEGRLLLEQEVYGSNAEVAIRVTNDGPTSLFFGLDYMLEKKVGDDWKRVPTKGMVAVPSIGYSVGPGGSWEQAIRFEAMPDGRYRFGKTVDGTGTSIRETLYAEFEVRS